MGIMPKGDKLTFKQKLFVQKYVENKGNGTQTALQVYDTTNPKIAQSIATENLSKPLIKESIDQIAAKQGITHSTILDTFKDLATRKVDKVSADAKLKANIEMAKVLGMYPSTKHARLNINLKGSVKDMNYQEVKNELKVIDDELATVMNEANKPTTPTP